MDEIREAVEGLVTGTLAFLYSLFSERKAERLKIKILRARLLEDGYERRSLTRLARSIGQSKESTTELLLKMGASPSIGGNEFWKLDK